MLLINDCINMSKVFKNKIQYKGKKRPGKQLKFHHRNYEFKEIEEKRILCQEKLDATAITDFSQFPISKRTLKGLSEAGFTKPTDIQKDGISLALRGLDVLAAAKTGSGKTLAFIIPVLELLWRDKWSNTDGLGALIMSPTRELALQTFEVLRKVGKHHDFSAGLVIGGKDVEEEQSRILNTNIIICTPGRLLQHFDSTANFQSDDLKILILDEADRILDLGFANTMNAIIENLPEERQTLLYSATQTSSIRDLARLSLKKPEYISVHEHSKYSTPRKLVQSYAVIELHQKIDFLFSFIKNHLKSKCIVFLSSCKQVKFIFEVFRKIRPGIPLQALYGKQKQMKRVGVYQKFCNTQHAVLFATDIAARGLDFPAVSWVIQFDCAENVDTYIHRVGRTARYEKGGQALLMILPSEVNVIKKLEERKIPIHEIKPNPKKLRSIAGKLQALCAQDQEIKHWAQRSIVSYARSIHLQSDKNVFDVTKLPLDAFASSCGLLAPPKIRFMKKMTKKIGPDTEVKTVECPATGKRNVPVTGKLGIEVLASKHSRFQNKKKDITTNKNTTETFLSSDSESEDNVLVKKTTNLNHELIDDDMKTMHLHALKQKIVTKASLAKKVLRKNIKVNTKIVFNDYGEGEYVGVKNDDEVNLEALEPVSLETSSKAGGLDVEEAKVRMKKQDRIDRELERKKIKLKHKEIKKKERQERQAMAQGSSVAMLSCDASMAGEQDDESVEARVSDGEEEIIRSSPRKKRRMEKETVIPQQPIDTALLEDEELAMHLLATT